VSESLTEGDMSPQTTGGNDASGGGRGDTCDGYITVNHQEKERPGTVQENECLPLLSSRMVGAEALTPICIYSPPMNSKEKKDLAEALGKILL